MDAAESVNAETISQVEGSVLSDRDSDILEFERQWWKYAGAKEQAITKQFSISPANYYQLLNQLIETDAALAYDPMLVKRLRRLRTTKRRVRTGNAKY